MIATLYQPGQAPQEVSSAGFGDLFNAGLKAIYAARASTLLECAPTLVDVLASGQGYVAYAVFDHDGGINTAAMEAVTALSGLEMDPNDEDQALRGPVLIITA